MPRQAEPEPPIVVLCFHERNAADGLIRVALQSQRPMPRLTTPYRWEGAVAVVGQSAIIRILSWNMIGQEPHDLPFGKQMLSLLRVGKLQRAQFEPRCL